MPGILIHDQATVMRQVFIDLGIGVGSLLESAVWPVYALGEPNKPDDCVTIYSTQGRDAGRHMVTGERPEFHGFQVRVRSKNYKEGYTKAREIAVALDEDIRLTEATVDENSYLVWSVTRTTDVIILGKEGPGGKRSLFTINAVASIKDVDSGTGYLLLEDGFSLLQEDGYKVVM